MLVEEQDNDIHTIITEYDITTVIQYSLPHTDDFAGAAHMREHAQQAHIDLIKITKALGLQLPPAKCGPPTTEIEWLGFFVMTTEMRVEISKGKLQDVLADCRKWTIGKRASRHDLQRLVGQLQYIAKCIRSPREYCSATYPKNIQEARKLSRKHSWRL